MLIPIKYSAYAVLALRNAIYKQKQIFLQKDLKLQ